MSRQSDEVNHLAAALVAFQTEMGAVPKTSTNPFFRSNYADLATCVLAATPLATTHGIAVTQHIGMGYLTTRLWHSSGQWIEEDMDLTPVKEHDPQAQGSAVTYARRYAYCAALGIVADKDDDAEAAMKRQSPARQAGTSFSAPQEYEEVNGEQIPVVAPMETTRTGPPSDLATPKQISWAKRLLNDMGIGEGDALETWWAVNVEGAWPGMLNNMTKKQASTIIELLK